MWVRQWPRFWLELLLKLLGKLFLGCYFGYVGGAILRFLDRLDRIWLGVMEMWLPREKQPTKPGKGMKEMLALPLDEGFCIPVDFNLWNCVYNAKGKEMWFHPSFLLNLHFHSLRWWDMVCSTEDTCLQANVCSGVTGGLPKPEVGK